MTDEPRTLLPRPLLTPEQADRRDVFVTACKVLDQYEPEWIDAFIGRGIVGDKAGWNKLKQNELHWVARNCAPKSREPPRFDAFWLLVEEQHAALQAVPVAPPQSE